MAKKSKIPPQVQKPLIPKLHTAFLQRVRRDGVNEAVAWLEKEGAGSDRDQFLAEALAFSARATLLQHPSLASVIAKEAVSLGLATASIKVTQMLAHDALGEHAPAKALAAELIEDKSLSPEQCITACNLLCRFEDQDRSLVAAKAAFERLESPVKHAGTLLYIALKYADWPFVDQLTAMLNEAYARGDFTVDESPRTHVLWCDDEAVNLKKMRQWNHRALNKRPKQPPVFKFQPLEGRRLRVGYLSSDYRNHPTSRLINGLLRHHDKAQVEVTLYDSGWDDRSDIRYQVLSHADHVKSVAALSDEDAAALIRQDQIDVLVELNGPTRANRMGVLQYRAAPVQIDYLGWPGSVGGGPVDYVVGDMITVPVGREANYPEKVIRIERVYQVNDYASQPRPAESERSAYGLPNDAPVLGMFNAINKVRGEVWQAWMEILKAVPAAVIWLLDPGVAARKNIASFTRECGVDPRRVIIARRLPQEAHLKRLQCCDLMLDPWPYGGHTSTADAVFSGVPVLALEGHNFAARVSGALLRAAGLNLLVQQDVAGYVKLGIRLLKSPAQLARVKAWVRDRAPKSDIFDAESKARQLEAAYKHVYERAAQALPPAHVNVAPKRRRSAQENSPPSVDRRAPLAETLREPALQETRLKLATDRQRVEVKLPLVLVCGPWSSGTSAVAGMLANAGLQAPGPHVKVNDPRTSATYEMRAFQKALRELASEQTLQKLAEPGQALRRLQQFRDEELIPAIEQIPDMRPLMLKHGLASLFLPELCALFELRIVGVLRSMQAIEATRIRRKWHPSMGRQGAQRIYNALFYHLVNDETPFHLVRYSELVAAPTVELDKLVAFCGLQPTEAQRDAALAFVDRSPSHAKSNE